MRNKFSIQITQSFDRNYQKLIKQDHLLEKKIIAVLQTLSNNPFAGGLKTHKVQSRNFGIAYSSRVTGDLRIIWSFVDSQFVIIALSIGGHSGSQKVYN